MSSNAMKVITPRATLSYPHLHAPQEGSNGGKAKYSASLVFAPGTDLSGLQSAMIAAAVAKFGATMKIGGKEFPVASLIGKGTFRSPFRTDAEMKGYASGSTFINVRTEQRPGIVYAYAGPDGKTPAIMPVEKVKDEMYPGAIVLASVTAFGYDREGNKGVSFALNSLQKVGEGERLDGRVAAENEFSIDLSAQPADLAALIG